MTTFESTIERLPKSRIKCTATFTEASVAVAEEEVIRTLGREVTIAGFRPGHAPADQIRAKIGEERMLEETVRNLLPGVMESAIREHGIKPVIHPHVAVEKRDPLTVSITFVERPPVKLKGIGKIAVEKKEPKAEEKDIESTVRYILEKHQSVKEVDRPARKDDRLTIDFWGEDEGGQEIQGIRTTNHEATIGSNVHIPGFEDALMGLCKSDRKDFTITFPAKYHAEALQNKPITFHVAVQKVEEVHTPELTDEFAKTVLRAESAEALRKDIRASILAQEERMEHQRREGLLLEEIRKATQVDLPEELIAEETRSMVEEFQEQLGRQQMTVEQWITASGKKAEDVQKDFKDRAEKRLQLRLGMQQLIEEKKVEVNDEEMDAHIREFLSPLSPDERLKIAPSYAKGERAYDQLLWQRKVEKVLEELLR